MEKEEIIKNKIIDKGSSPNGFSDSPKQVDVDEFTADFDNTDDKPLNIAKIRDRTFNKELSEILADIRSNELEYNDDEVALDEITEMELLKRFHELFYKAIHLDNLQNVNTSKNPYLYPDIFLEDDCEKKIADEMNRLLYPEFAILAYNPKKKCYSPVHFYSDVLVEDNIAVYTSEELYAQILVNRCGVIIDQQTITDNIFLKKRFSSISEDQSHYLLYFVSFQNILKEIFDEMNLSNGNNQTNYRFQILMIILKDSRSEDIVEVIYKKIKDNLTFYFLKLENKLLNKVNELDFEDPNIIYNIFVYIYQILPTFSDAAGFIIECNNNSYKENLFIFKFLITKLHKILPEKSLIFRITKDRIFILTQNSEKESIEQIIDEYNNINCDSLMLRESMGIKNNNISSLMHECIF